MKFSNILLVYTKELRDLLRDRRTVLAMFIIPSLVMPGLMFGFGLVAKTVVGKAKEETPVVTVVGAENSPRLVEALREKGGVSITAAPADVNKAISDKALKAALEIPTGFEQDLSSGKLTNLRVLYFKGDIKSEIASSKIESVLSEYQQEIVKRRLKEKGLSDGFIKPYDFNRQNVAPSEKVGGSMIGGLIPYLFILLCYTGAMYPALDLTSGEKERGTLETILCSPLNRLELVLGKFLMVLTSSLATVVSAFTSFAIWWLVIGGSMVAGGEPMATPPPDAAGLSLSIPGLIGVFFLVLPLAVLFSSLLLGLGLFAKTMKEAQSYAGPATIVVLVPGMMALLPGIELNAKLALVPILNVALVSKEMVGGNFPWTMILLIFGSTAVYSGLALAWAARQFNREDVLFRT